jgi:telomere length regulation protein
MNQRFAVLSSLALGAREIAGLPSLLPAASSTDGDPSKKAGASFPTQRLPPTLHAEFMAAQENPDTSSAGRALDLMTEDITKLALSQTRQSAEQSLPGAAKEKLLTVRQQTRVLSKSSGPAISANGSDTKVSFASLAVEIFIMPLVNRFWLYLRDISTSPQDRKLGPYAGGGAGTAPLLEPMMLSKYLQTLCVLLNAAKNSPHFLAVLAPETLELVLSLRSLETTSNVVQESMMQLVLVVLDTSTNVDGGRTLARDFSRLTWQIKDWAEDTWKSQEQSGKEIAQAGRAAAGVLLRIDDVVQKTIGYR